MASALVMGAVAFRFPLAEAERLLSRRSLVLAAGSYGALRIPAASAKYGEFAKTSGGQDQMAVGDSSNECMFAQPGSGICTVYKSSDPPAWSSPDTDVARSKLIRAAEQLREIGTQIEGKRWTLISQTLGSSRDLREAVGFLTAASGDPAAVAAAKKVSSFRR